MKFTDFGGMTLTAYNAKIKELPLVSLFCSCLFSEPRDKAMHKTEGVVELNYVIKDVEVIELNKRASGQAFEVILRAPSFDGIPGYNTSPEGLQKKVEETAERKRCQEAELLKHTAEEREQEHKPMPDTSEANQTFIKTPRDRLEQKTETNKKQRGAHLATMLEPQQEKDRHAEEVP